MSIRREGARRGSWSRGGAVALAWGLARAGSAGWTDPWVIGALAGGLALQAAGLGWVAWLASSGSGYGRFVLPMIIAGVGVSMAVPAVPAAALGAVAPQDMGRASGVNNTLQSTPFAEALRGVCVHPGTVALAR